MSCFVLLDAVAPLNLGPADRHHREEHLEKLLPRLGRIGDRLARHVVVVYLERVAVVLDLPSRILPVTGRPEHPEHVGVRGVLVTQVVQREAKLDALLVAGHLRAAMLKELPNDLQGVEEHGLGEREVRVRLLNLPLLFGRQRRKVVKNSHGYPQSSAAAGLRSSSPRTCP